MTTPFRTSSPPCPRCEAREQADSKMLSFVTDGYRKCPECQSSNYLIFRLICHGTGRFALHNGFWFFRWWDRDVYECEIKESPKHMHFICKLCNTHWLMKTATEEPVKEKE